MLSSQYQEALSWVASLHAQQRRKIDNTPYLAHLLSVSALVLESGGTEHQAIAALLHDAVEDQGASLDEIRTRFGPTVADYVAALTEPTTNPPRPWQERKEQYLRQIQAASSDLALIALADKLHNVRSIEAGLQDYGDALWDLFFHSRRQETLWFYQALLEIFQRKGLTHHWLTIQLRTGLLHIFPEARNLQVDQIPAHQGELAPIHNG